MTQRTQSTFGFEPVAPKDRQAKVNGIFTTVAKNYDLMNDVMSGGLHRMWKAELLNWLDPHPHEGRHRLLDMAGGTGDVALRFAHRLEDQGHATLCDINPDMLRVAQSRIDTQGLSDRIRCVEANAEAIPFEEGQFDSYVIAMGIRNVTRIDMALSEAFRVLKPGGRFMCLEFGKVQNPVLSRLYDLHSFEAIPRIGRLIAGSAKPYRYLVESIRTFPSQEDFLTMVKQAGFERATYRNLISGVAVIYSATRPS